MRYWAHAASVASGKQNKRTTRKGGETKDAVTEREKTAKETALCSVTAAADPAESTTQSALLAGRQISE
ncbi:hypothetical protein PC116_g16327 [Phytophthora cactorum]|uniref:Uncharacterized protein n=1 Tax=Phytophthora cactorum TaxID=29920 RepID=A0A8T1B6L5_9STRA|nr:hypothetical protein PC111_g19947 [Phytophthora cactorum]KAG2804244.1 hypothetical protein PC112_g18807 [Phytophthora cactorum]KAG2854960.1 hypothetical protein PC113_g12862 [Phytophthora cactorum]KAG2897534.1 hypothetical protein PC115_g17138 [Phytophthora cactorum]KAG4235539.1 hypothetical protein PC116_g16327 [Phytophthora cactorum]